MRLFSAIAPSRLLSSQSRPGRRSPPSGSSLPKRRRPIAAVLDAARAKVAAGDTKGAIEGLAPYVASHPRDLAAGRLLGDLYFRVPDYPKAEKVWKAVLAVDAEDRETHSRLGALYAVARPGERRALRVPAEPAEQRRLRRAGDDSQARRRSAGLHVQAAGRHRPASLRRRPLERTRPRATRAAQVRSRVRRVQSRGRRFARPRASRASTSRTHWSTWAASMRRSST